MSDNLDNDLKNRIRDVFENYEDASADAGWQLLRQRFPEKKRRRPAALWWYSAAAVLLICFGMWFLYPQKNSEVVSRSKKARHIDQNKTAPLNESIQTNKPAQDSNTRQMAAENQDENAVSKLNPQLAQRNSESASAYHKPQKHGQKQFSADQYVYENKLTAKLHKSIKKVPADNYPNSNTGAVPSIAQAQKPSDSNSPAEIMANADRQLKTNAMVVDSLTGIKAGTAAKQPSVLAKAAPDKPKQDAISKMFADDEAKEHALTKNENKKKQSQAGSKSVMMSVYAATYFNYAKGSSNEVNVGAGFTSDFRISSNLKLSTGVAIAQNSLNFNSNSIPNQLNAKVAATANAAQVSTSNYTFNASLPVVNSATVKNYNASLIGLDIPINIKYEFDPQKSDAYISAGISSGTYIDENYSSSYTYNNAYVSANGLVSANSITTPTQQTSAHQHFSSFDFAKTLNFSFGVGYPVGRNRLIVEPFLKYPLSGLGSQDIKFGAGGLNLKLNINSGRKK